MRGRFEIDVRSKGVAGGRGGVREGAIWGRWGVVGSVVALFPKKESSGQIGNSGDVDGEGNIWV